jgi:asparagine synthase (glutamine-hydrolysing)
VCGIAGIFAYGSTASMPEREELYRMRDDMAARGPDGVGEWISPVDRIALGHRRLSIIDLSEQAAQPMQSADGRLVVVFNGEIYNYRGLRSELEGKGHVFRTDSDTEVLLHLYSADGVDMVHRLRGMFAFALVDRAEKKILLSRDPFGIKPLYYADDGKSLRFASQVKALLAGGEISREPDPAGWTGFHLFGSVPEPFTTYRDIRALPAGSTLMCASSGVLGPVQYFDVGEVYRDAERRKPDHPGQQDLIRAALLDSVRHHMVADVPVGIFLSAGVDSGALLGLMRDAAAGGIQAVTLAYEEFRQSQDNEAPLAALCARRYSTSHHVRVVAEEEFRADIPKIFDAMDQPSIDGINTWFVSKAAGELGLKAAISGLGGDELFGGYPSFRAVPRLARFLAAPSRVPFAGDIFCRFALSSGLASILNPKVAGLLKYGGDFAGSYFLKRGLFMPWELPAVMDAGFAAEGLERLDPRGYVAGMIERGPESDFGKMATLESTLYMRNQLLRDTDWASMAHSVEVRVPLVDAWLLRKVAPATMKMAGRVGKRLLAASPSRALPRAIVARTKTGFNTPVSQWLQRDQRLQAWRRIPELASPRCPWARRWAYQSAAA